MLIQPPRRLFYFRCDFLWLYDTDFPTESKYPGEKGRAGRSIHGGLEVFFIYDLCLHLSPKRSITLRMALFSHSSLTL